MAVAHTGMTDLIIQLPTDHIGIVAEFPGHGLHDPIQLRLGEALCILPVLTPAAVPALFVGCILANLLGGAIPLDVIFGSMATLLGAVGTYALRNRPILCLLPPIAANTAIVPLLLYFAYGFRDTALPLLFLSVFVGEALSAGVLGFILRKSIAPFSHIFK